jgi:hypothetical protein
MGRLTADEINLGLFLQLNILPPGSRFHDSSRVKGDSVVRMVE